MLCSIALLGALVSTPALAHDAHLGSTHNHINGARVELHANISQYSTVGVGGRVEFALVPEGLIGGNVRDELALSLGGDVFFAPVYWGSGYVYNGGAYAVPIGVIQWNFYLGGHWSVFAEAGLAAHLSFEGDGWSDPKGRDFGSLYATPALGIGARFHFTDRVALLMRLSTPGGAQIGATF